MAPAFATGGQFFNISSEVQDLLPLVVDSLGLPIEPNASTGSDFFVVDLRSGTTLQMQSSLQTNFQVFNDALINVAEISEIGQVVPYVWVLKQSTLSKDTIKSLLGYQLEILRS